MLRGVFGGLIRTHDLRAKLHSSERRGPRARMSFQGWANGRYRLRIDIEDRDYILAAHDILDVVIDGHVVGAVPLRPGKRRTRFTRTERDGPLGFQPAAGQPVALGQDGIVLVSGRFAHDD